MFHGWSVALLRLPDFPDRLIPFSIRATRHIINSPAIARTCGRKNICCHPQQQLPINWRRKRAEFSLSYSLFLCNIARAFRELVHTRRGSPSASRINMLAITKVLGPSAPLIDCEVSGDDSVPISRPLLRLIQQAGATTTSPYVGAMPA